MRKTFASLALAAAFSLSLTAAAGAAPASRFGMDFAVVPQPGLLFAGSVDPGYSGTAIALTPFYQSGMLRLEAGLEAGSSPIGWQVLAPLRAGARFLLPPFSLEVLAEAAPGAALFQQAPLLLLGAGALGRFTWNAGSRVGIFVSVGVRATFCPAYGTFTGLDYSTLDIPLSLGIRWTFKANT
jgi:hypothetical protein